MIVYFNNKDISNTKNITASVFKEELHGSESDDGENLHR